MRNSSYGACREVPEVPVPDPQSSGLSELEVSLARRGEQVAYAPKSPHVSLGIGNRMGQGQLTCTTRSPIAASTGAVIVEIFESYSIGRIPGRLSLSALVAAAYVQSTGRPGPRIQMAGFICGSPTTRG